MMLFIFLLGLSCLVIITSFYWRSSEIVQESTILVENPVKSEERFEFNGQIKIA